MSLRASAAGWEVGSHVVLAPLEPCQRQPRVPLPFSPVVIIIITSQKKSHHVTTRRTRQGGWRAAAAGSIQQNTSGKQQVNNKKKFTTTLAYDAAHSILCPAFDFAVFGVLFFDSKYDGWCCRRGTSWQDEVFFGNPFWRGSCCTHKFL